MCRGAPQNTFDSDDFWADHIEAKAYAPYHKAKVAGNLCRWVRAVVAARRLSEERVEPADKEIAKLDAKLPDAQGRLDENTSVLREAEVRHETGAASRGPGLDPAP